MTGAFREALGSPYDGPKGTAPTQTLSATVPKHKAALLSNAFEAPWIVPMASRGKSARMLLALEPDDLRRNFTSLLHQYESRSPLDLWRTSLGKEPPTTIGADLLEGILFAGMFEPGNARSTTRLAHFLGDPDPVVRLRAAWALRWSAGTPAGNECAPQLAILLADPDDEVRALTATSLAFVAPSTPGVLQALLAAERAERAIPFLAFERALLAVSEWDADTARWLRGLLDLHGYDALIANLRNLARLGAQAAIVEPEVRRLLQHEDPRICAAARAVARNFADRATPHQDPSPTATRPTTRGGELASQPAAPPIVGRHGGRKGAAGPAPGPSLQAIEKGLRWLVAVQRDDGRWSEATGKEDGQHDVGLTAIALLALHAGGSTKNAGAHGEAVSAGTSWLVHVQRPDGRFGTMTPPDFVHDHLLAAFALVEHAGAPGGEELRGPALAALRYVESHRNREGLLGMAPKDGVSETPATVLAMRAMRSAREFSIVTDDKELGRIVLAWLDEVADPETGVAGYSKRGDTRPSRPDDPLFLLPSPQPLALTASSAYARFLLGRTPAQDPVLDKACTRIAAAAPDPNARPIALDVFAFYYGTAALYLAGEERFQRWRTPVERLLVAAQVRDGEHAGSWAPDLDAWGRNAGRVYTTGFALLTLQTLYRYARLMR